MAITHVNFRIEEVKLKKLADIYQGGITVVHVDDAEYDDHYEIHLQRTNLGLGGMCSLNGSPSYQADFKRAPGNGFLKDVINKIAAGRIIGANGSMVNIKKVSVLNGAIVVNG